MENVIRFGVYALVLRNLTSKKEKYVYSSVLNEETYFLILDFSSERNFLFNFAKGGRIF